MAECVYMSSRPELDDRVMVGHIFFEQKSTAPLHIIVSIKDHKQIKSIVVRANELHFILTNTSTRSRYNHKCSVACGCT